MSALKLACAMRLSDEGYWPYFEVTLDAKRHFRADVYAINGKFQVVVVEVKSCVADFRSDTKWREYLPYCTKFYFAADPETIEVIRAEVEPEKPAVGYITLKSWGGITPYSAQVVKPADRQTWGVFSDPEFLLRLIKSDCLFVKGLYRGLRKINRRFLDSRYDKTVELNSPLLDCEE